MMNSTRTYLRFAALFGACMTLSGMLVAQSNPGGGPDAMRREAPARPSTLTAVDPRLEPFYHGVASGDPTPDGIILWTRVTPPDDNPISVQWELASDTGFTAVLQSGTVQADTSTDYTVKLALSGLASGTTYYYRFRALDRWSLTGRTRTASQDASQLRFVVVSCNNYPAGYFNAFGRIAERNDLDAVIHLGDFIYEYGEGDYGGSPDRQELEPETETVNLQEYRQRYGWYRLDPDLRRAMQQHPFIFVWDDHESANDAWTGGAQNHDPLLQGDWSVRRRRAARAYFEWTPIRDEPNFSIYRKFSFGDLADLHMLDTRLEGRQEQISDYFDPLLWNPDRTILGPVQFAWLSEGLRQSEARWKLIGNQVVFAPLLLDNFESIYPGVRNQFLDVWNGYPAERSRLLDTLATYGIENTVFLTGDVHVSMALDVPDWNGDTLFYDTLTAAGSRAVEFVGTSVSSDNFDEVVGVFLANLVEGLFLGENPHASYNEFDRHGYFLVDLTAERAQGDYFYVNSILEPDSDEAFDAGWFTLSGENRLRQASGPAPLKPVQEIPAPDPTRTSTGLEQAPDAGLYLWNAFPNPLGPDGQVNLAFSLNRFMELKLSWLSTDGSRSLSLRSEALQPGHWQWKVTVPGSGLLLLEGEGVQRVLRVVRP